MTRFRWLAVFGLALLTRAAAAQAPAPAALTADDYRRAESFLGYRTAPLVMHAGVRPTFLADGRFWYRTQRPEGAEFVLVDPARRVAAPAFDHGRVAEALAKAAGRPVERARLPFTAIDLSPEGQVLITLGDRRYACDPAGTSCVASERPPSRPQSVSPDGSRAVFIRDWNLWVRDLRSGAETALTTDGVKDYGYATDNAGWRFSDAPVVKWSPDSSRVATFRQDQRQTSEMYLVSTNVGKPVLQAWKYPLPGDPAVTMIERVIIDVATGAMVRLRMPPDQHRSSVCDDIICGGDWVDVQWAADSRSLAFLSTSRDHRRADLRVADVQSGEIREVMHEEVATFFESGNDAVNWRYLPAAGEVLWYSQRTDWGHLYLYDLRTGTLQRALTSGTWNVTQVLHIDAAARVIFFEGVGREPGRNPYYRHLYRVDMDGRNLRLLTPEDADHDISLAPDGRTFVSVAATPDTPPVARLRSAAGDLLLTLETADLSRLTAAGWQAPQRITVKARDGVTDLHGLMYRPTRFDPARTYPIINNIYPGPQTGSVGSRQFAASRGDTQALAELGFIVVQIDGMGTPWRSKSFHEKYYGDMGDNTLPDQVAAMKELAARYPYIDLDRAGIYGHSGGGFAAAGAMFRYPDFFKVGVSQAGNHDNRNYEDDWAEKWQGLLVTRANGTTSYDNQANQLVASQLKGKLLLAHGTLDSNVPMYGTLLVVNALISANKDFDLLLLPNRGHGFGSEPYMLRRRWDYFVQHLLRATPPVEFAFTPPTDPR